MNRRNRDEDETSTTPPDSIYGEGAESEDTADAAETFDDESENPDLLPGKYPSDPNVGDATTPPSDEARKDAEKPR